MRAVVLGLSLTVALAGGVAYATLARRPIAAPDAATSLKTPETVTPGKGPAPGGDLSQNGTKPSPGPDGGAPGCWGGECTRVSCRKMPDRRESEDLHAALARHLREVHFELPAVLERFPGAKIAHYDAAEGRVELTHEGKALVLDLDVTFKTVRLLEPLEIAAIPAPITAKLEERFPKHDPITAAWGVEGGGVRVRFRHESRRCVVKENGGNPMRAMILVHCDTIVLLDKDGGFVDQREVAGG